MTNYWISWYGKGEWELHWPWWVSGYRMDGDEDAGTPDTPTICAAVQAANEEAAKEIILAAHDTRPDNIEWRFVNERPAGWTPFCGRFPRADWMKWPAQEPAL